MCPLYGRCEEEEGNMLRWGSYQRTHVPISADQLL